MKKSAIYLTTLLFITFLCQGNEPMSFLNGQAGGLGEAYLMGYQAPCSTDVIPPVITCPTNLTVNIDPGSCSANIRIDLTPMASDNCSFELHQTAGISDDNDMLWSWGRDYNGSLGNGPAAGNQDLPYLTNTQFQWKTIEANGFSGFGIRRDGSLWAWGDNYYGQLGTGNRTPTQSPVQIGSDTNWVTVSSTDAVVLALKSDSSLWAWGANGSGTLGIGNNINQLTPVPVAPSQKWIRIAAGQLHCLAIAADSSLWAWGYGNYGALGTYNWPYEPPGTDYNIPTRVGTASDWIDIAVSPGNSFGIRADGTLWSWGYDWDGLLGNGNIPNYQIVYDPTQVGTASNWVDISTKILHCLALKDDGSLWSWGYDNHGQLGHGPGGNRKYAPTQVGSATDWEAISAGGRSSMARKSDGSLWLWGNDFNGLMGNGPGRMDQYIPTQLGQHTGWTLFGACGGSAYALRDSGYTFPVGITTQSWQVTDASGNTAACSFTVTVNDTDAPMAQCQAASVYLDAAGEAFLPASEIDNGSSDHCGGAVTFSASPHTFACGDTGPQTVNLTVMDAAGNTAACTATVTVLDTISPVVNCPASDTLYLTKGCFVPYEYDITKSDNCKTFPMSSEKLFLSPGVLSRNFQAKDPSGNIGRCSFSITVIDPTPPTINCPSDYTLPNGPNQCGAVLNYQINSSDNCPGKNLNQTGGMASGSLFPIGITYNSFEVSDASGNTASCAFSVTVNDTEAPSIACPSSITTNSFIGQCSRTVSYLTPVGTDNCASANTQLMAGLGSGSSFPLGVNTETYIVTDASGNTASCAFTITIEDSENPAITLLGANPLILCEGDAYIEAGANATDNCDAAVGQNIMIDASSVNAAQAGTYAVSYTVTDFSGNSAQLTRTVVVNHTPAQLAPQNCGSCAQIRFDFCEGDAAPDLEALLTANANYESGVSFLWYADNSSSQGSPISRPSPNMLRNNTRFYWVSQSINNCESEVRRVRVRVRKTSLAQLDLPTIGCGTAQIDLAAWVSDSRGIATGFTFYDADPSANSGQSPTLGTSPLGTVTATAGAVNSGQYAIVSLPASPVTYYAVASNNTGCQVTGSDEVSAAAGASLDPVANITVNSGDLVQVNFSSPDATHILWLNHSSFNNPYIGLIGSIGFGDLVFTANNPASSPQTAMLRAIAYNGNCAGQVRDFTITVLPGTQNRQTRNSLQLTASKINAHDVRLNWQIEYEFALTHIEIEKLRGEDEWVKIGESPLMKDQFIDRSGMSNVTQYRLKLIHADGRAIWSQEVEVTFDYYDSQRFTLYPNPSNGRFKLRAAGPLEGEWRYKLSDQLGRTILIGKLQGSETAFDISGLPTAHYFLLLTSPEGKAYLRKIAKR